MVRRALLGACLTVVLVWGLGGAVPDAQQNSAARPAAAPDGGGPIKLARHPDYHAGKVTFSVHGRHLDRQ